MVPSQMIPFFYPDYVYSEFSWWRGAHILIVITSNNDKHLGAVCHLPIYVQFIQLGVATMGPTPGGGVMPNFTLSEPGYS